MAHSPNASKPSRKWLRHDVPAWVAEDAIYFVTINCQRRGVNQLCHDDIGAALLESARFYHRRRWWVHVWLLMPDHLHALLSFSREEIMINAVASWKRYTARTLRIEWQDGFFDHRLRNDENLLAKSEYIRMNPVRSGLINDPDRWPFMFSTVPVG
jgi:REP element-mobilizing transposase RayT